MNCGKTPKKLRTDIKSCHIIGGKYAFPLSSMRCQVLLVVWLKRWKLCRTNSDRKWNNETIRFSEIKPEKKSDSPSSDCFLFNLLVRLIRAFIPGDIVQEFNQSLRLVTLGHKWRHGASCSSSSSSSSRVSWELHGQGMLAVQSLPSFTCSKSICRLFRPATTALVLRFAVGVPCPSLCAACLALERISRLSEAQSTRWNAVIWTLCKQWRSNRTKGPSSG